MTITSLPVGEYAIRIAQGDYRKNLPVRLGGPNATNELKVEFRYGKLSFISEPPEANVTARGKVIGQTPTTLKLPPDSYQFQIQKDGFFGTNVSLTLLETDSRTVSVSLANVAFVEAIERAHQHAALHEYERAFSDVEKALRIQPDHEAALRLQRTIQFHLHLQNGRQFFRTGEHTKALMEADAALKLKDGDAETLALRAEVEKSQLEAKAARAKARQEKEAVEMETRRKRPENVLNDVSRQFPHHQFFDNEQIRFIGSVDKVSTGVLMALRRDPQWNILRDEKVDGDIAVTVAELRGLLKKQRAVIVTGQIADDEVVVYFKLFQLAGPSGASEEGYQPFLARDETGVRAELITKRLNREVLEFRNRINDGVLNHGKSN